ncbi:hypothetical protein GXW71_31115 [Roseomonas hellenica]|uniref:ABC-type transport auxiliary lipoprotein component domain-containing protein n=1 Tax=Plastoroseomonas hellenica TaxID=2687306 RepID=A0ABS5F8E8_9PROT|nr:hypothetical protein [Plastoroseomonas hellenica]MBR0668841.1 hypothetical protein [Plastoroseomonas hellenica]
MTLQYSQTVSAVTMGNAPLVAVRSPAVNDRVIGRERANWIGRQVGGLGGTFLEMSSDQPVGEVVARAFADGLRLRGLLAADEAQAPYILAITMHQLDVSRYGRTEGTADFSLVLSERATGREIWRDRHRIQNIEGSAMSLAGMPIMAQEIRDSALLSMNQAVDALLDKDEFRAALRR